MRHVKLAGRGHAISNMCLVCLYLLKIIVFLLRLDIRYTSRIMGDVLITSSIESNNPYHKLIQKQQLNLSIFVIDGNKYVDYNNNMSFL